MMWDRLEWNEVHEQVSMRRDSVEKKKYLQVARNKVREVVSDKRRVRRDSVLSYRWKARQ
jgi:hypothetical protein